MLYNFEVVKHGSVLQTQTIHLPHIRDAWPTIVRLARRFRERGHRIRVKDQAGGIVILTGVAAARRHGEGITDIPVGREASQIEPSPHRL